MSLRDQLLAKGLVNKKDAERVERELKEQRRQKQGSRERKHAEEARVRAEEAAALAAQVEARAQARRQAEAERDAREQVLRVRRMILDTKVRVRGKQLYWHRRHQSASLARLSVSPQVAVMLRAGELGIAALLPLTQGGEVEYHVVPARTIHRLTELAPELIMAFTRDPRGISQPDEAFLDASWEISLRPHRWHPPAPATAAAPHRDA